MPQFPERERSIEPELLPGVIDAPYPFISIQDLGEVSRAVLDQPFSDEMVRSLEDELHEIQRHYAPPESTFFTVSATELSSKLEQVVRDEAARIDRHIGIVYLDKYLGHASNTPTHVRLELSRGSDNALVPRTGCTVPVDQQLKALADWAAAGRYDEVLLVDDVLAFGSTVPVIAAGVRERLPEMQLRLLTGIAASGGIWQGIEKVEEANIVTEHLTRVKASDPIEGRTTGMALPVARDFTLFGGRAGGAADGGRETYPYFLPFSKPLLSLIDKPVTLTAAEAYLDFNERFISCLESQNGRTIHVEDITAAGFGVPSTALTSLEQWEPPNQETPLRAVIDQGRNALHSHTEAILAELGDD